MMTLGNWMPAQAAFIAIMLSVIKPRVNLVCQKSNSEIALLGEELPCSDFHSTDLLTDQIADELLCQLFQEGHIRRSFWEMTLENWMHDQATLI